MPESEDIEAQRELLRVYRRNLALYLQQQAEQGGSAYVTPVVANGILDARAEIAQIKAVLRGWGQTVDDHPNDLPASPAPSAANPPKHPRAVDVSEPQALPPIVVISPTTAIDPDGLEAYFTDVEQLRDAFRQLVSAPALPKRLLVIHGVGGAGKSSLLRMFRIYARRAGVPIALASGDEVKSVVDLLAGWSDDLQAAGVRLPTTAKTLARYRGVQTTVERQAQKASAVAGKLALKTAEGVAGSVAGAAIGSVFPVIGTVAGAAVGALVGAGGEAFSEWLGTFLKRPDIDLLLDPTRQLTNAFLADISVAATHQRIVLLLDTFEQLSALEDWARDFAQRLHPNVLLVIGGRAVPGWGRAWPGWLAPARIEELKPMTSQIMRELIGRYYATMHGGTPEPAQVEAIINFAQGLPVVVTSAVQLWVAYGVEDFQSVKPQVIANLVDRLIEGVPRELVPMLEAAAALRWFNKDLLRAVTQQDDVNTAYDELRRFPFIRSRAEGLALHDAVREIVDENMRVNDPERHRELHERAAAYFEAKLVRFTGTEAEKLEMERMYQRIRADEGTGIQLFQEQAEELVRYRMVNRLRSLLIDVRTYSLQQETSRLWWDFYNAQLRYFEGRLWEGVDLFQAFGKNEQAETKLLGLDVYQTIGKNERVDPKLRGYALCELAVLRLATGFLREESNLQELAQTVAKSNALLSKTDSKKLINLVTMGKAYNDCSKIEEALKHFHEAIERYRERGDMYGVANAYTHLVGVYAVLGDWRKMFDMRSAGLENTPKSAKASIAYSELVGGWASAWAQAGRYAEAEHNSRTALNIKRALGIMYFAGPLRDMAFTLGMQGRYTESAQFFIEATRNFGEFSPKEDLSMLRRAACILLRQGDWQKAEKFLNRSRVTNVRLSKQRRLADTLNLLAYLCELRKDWHQAENLYREVLDRRSTKRYYSESAALIGLVRVKHAQGGYAAIPPLLAEAEALAQQYEYNDHLASLRLSQAQLAWDGALPALGRGFDAALAYYKQALIYALRYNRFLLDEVLWGGGVSTPLKPIIPHCLERTFEGQRMLTALRDWWQSGANDIGVARPDTISPIPEGIPLVEAERIARDREPGDGTPQRTVLEQFASDLNGRSGA